MRSPLAIAAPWVAALALAPAMAAAQTVALSGYVLAPDGSPIASAAVTDPRGPTVVATDANGRYVFASVARGLRRLQVTAAGYVPAHPLAYALAGAVEVGQTRLVAVGPTQTGLEAGGTAYALDGTIELVLAAGALPAQTPLTLTPVGPVDEAARPRLDGALGERWRLLMVAQLGPESTVLAGPATLRFAHDLELPAGSVVPVVRLDRSLRVWRPAGTAQLTADGAWFAVQVDRLGLYALALPTASPAPSWRLSSATLQNRFGEATYLGHGISVADNRLLRHVDAVAPGPGWQGSAPAAPRLLFDAAAAVGAAPQWWVLTGEIANDYGGGGLPFGGPAERLAQAGLKV